MEIRRCKITARRAGGKASKNAKKYSLGLPSKWVRQMGVTTEQRDMVISFDGTTITIRREDNPSALSQKNENDHQSAEMEEG